MESIHSELLHLDKDVKDESTSNDLKQQLYQLKTILANSTFNINEIVDKSTNGEYFIEDETTAFNVSSKTDEENIEISYKEDCGRISLAYERLPGIPQKIADEFALQTHTLDLSYNRLKDLSFLSNFNILHTLILDNNYSINENTLPNIRSLRILWLNNCRITQLSKWTKRIQMCTPNIRQLSLMGNPGVRSALNGGTTFEHYDYIMHVIRALPNLDYLDDIKITAGQRAMARAHVNARALNGSTINFRAEFSSTPNLLAIRKYDTKSRRQSAKHGNAIPKLMLDSKWLET